MIKNSGKIEINKDKNPKLCFYILKKFLLVKKKRASTRVQELSRFLQIRVSK